MYAVIRRVRPEAEPRISDEEVVRRVQQELVPVYSKIRGFVAYYLVDMGNREISTVSIFESRDGAEESTRIAKDWVTRNRDALGSMRFEVAAEGEVRVHQTAEHAVGAR